MVNASKGTDLLDFLAEKAGCSYLNELRELHPDAVARLLSELENLIPRSYPLKQWNDALNYLTSTPAQDTAEAARKELISFYTDRSV